MTAPHGPGAPDSPPQQPGSEASEDRPQQPGRAVSPGAPARPDPGPGWKTGQQRPQPDMPARTTVLPGGGAPAGARPPGPRPATPRPGPRPEPRPAGGARPVAARSRRARLALRRIDPWSVFIFSLIASLFLGIALVVATAVLYSVLGSLGVTGSLNELYAEVTGGSAATAPLLNTGRVVGGAAILAAVNIVLLTLLATLGSLLYNLCASFTGGLELTLGERD